MSLNAWTRADTPDDTAPLTALEDGLGAAPGLEVAVALSGGVVPVHAAHSAAARSESPRLTVAER